MSDDDFEQFIEESKVAFGCPVEEKEGQAPYHLLKFQQRYRFFVYLFPRLEEELKKHSENASTRNYLVGSKRKVLIEACMSKKKMTGEKRKGWVKASERDINSVLGLLYPKQYTAQKEIPELEPSGREVIKPLSDPDEILANAPINDELNPELAEFLGYTKKDNE